MRANMLASMRDELRKRRRIVVETTRRSQEQLEGLRGAERDPEFEEGAQREHEQYTLALLRETQQRHLSMIDAALARVDSGAYGLCADCETEIDRKRLAVLPFALLCAECAARRERGVAAEVEGPPP